ncbi:uncharacterized protein LOC127246680 [Andrographis paniculata]|uniref:uncharacterized protein LOC127246680 n=1 Tax=Andrographis paniculata TaxID=175694 RepID=UPI0021E8065A|nr:uncharacterized protein LOC127246680 [Andrographis paniculata]
METITFIEYVDWLCDDCVELVPKPLKVVEDEFVYENSKEESFNTLDEIKGCSEEEDLLDDIPLLEFLKKKQKRRESQFPKKKSKKKKIRTLDDISSRLPQEDCTKLDAGKHATSIRVKAKCASEKQDDLDNDHGKTDDPIVSSSSPSKSSIKKRIVSSHVPIAEEQTPGINAAQPLQVPEDGDSTWKTRMLIMPTIKSTRKRHR